MKIVKNHYELGVLLLVCLAFLSSCRSDPPPAFEICQGDGVGGADCDVPGNPEIQYRAPSQLKNAWIIPSQEDAQRFVAWCYDVEQETAMQALRAKQIKIEAK